ncbi:MAG: PAAR domain-containing protein [Coriobacteriia bacterium]|nr:PAAR domain-containing protein [Coriobacteriia bacterium]
MRATKARLTVRVSLVAALLMSVVVLPGCFGYTDADYIQAIKDWIEDWDSPGEEGSEESAAEGNVTLSLTFPAGASPKVFTTGWVFGARCVVETQEGTVDLSDSVKWSGTGSFAPNTGRTSRPSFSGQGANQITLSVEVEGKTVEKTFNLEAVSPDGYAAVGDYASCSSDGHGCPACPHPTTGPILRGSSNVFVRGKPAARQGDTGVTAACCGPNTFEIVEGDGTVLINGRPAAKFGSRTSHCGGVGKVGGS